MTRPELKMIDLKRGATRIVLLIGKYAIKIPSIFEWRLFLHGLLANLQEASFSRAEWEELCPVVLAVPGGWFLIMRRATPLSEEEFESLNYEEWVDRENYRVPVENKHDSFGILDGRIVAVDYGS